MITFQQYASIVWFFKHHSYRLFLNAILAVAVAAFVIAVVTALLNARVSALGSGEVELLTEVVAVEVLTRHLLLILGRGVLL